MDIGILFTGIKETLGEIGGMVTTVFGFIGKDKVDATEAMKQYYTLQLKIKDLDSYYNQLQSSIKEKLMVGATWIKPLALITGGGLVAVCAFNIVCKSVGCGNYLVEWSAPELLILLGMFIYVTSGSTEFVLAVAKYLLQKWQELKKNKI